MSDIKRMLGSTIQENDNYVSRDKAAESLRELTELEAKLIGLDQLNAVLPQKNMSLEDKLQVVEAMSAKLEDWKSKAKEKMPSMQMKIHELEAKLQVAVEALEFYDPEDVNSRAYLDVFDCITIDGSITSFDSERFGKRANEALEKLKAK